MSTAPTSHKTFNKAFNANGLFNGNAITPIQFSWYVRGVDELKCNDFTFAKGELYQKDVERIKNNISVNAPEAFWTKLYELASVETVCVYVFKAPQSNRPIAYAIGSKEGCKFFMNAHSTTQKQQEINAFIKQFMDTKGWF